MFKIVGILLIITSTTCFGFCKKMHYLQREKSLEQLLLMIKIIERELNFNCIKTLELIKLLSGEIASPIGKIFDDMYKFAQTEDLSSLEYKWSKMFREKAEMCCLLPKDIEIVINIATILGKYDVEEQLKSLDYCKNILSENLCEAKILSKNQGNIVRAIAISFGMILAIILI